MDIFHDRTRDVLARGLLVWLIIIASETVHAIVRNLVLEPLLGDFRARQVSVFIGSVIIIAITFIFVRWLKSSRATHFILIGAMWVALTVGFEIGLGSLVMDLSWERIFSDYNVAKGGLLPFGLLVMLLAPFVLAKIEDVT